MNNKTWVNSALCTWQTCRSTNVHWPCDRHPQPPRTKQHSCIYNVTYFKQYSSSDNITCTKQCSDSNNITCTIHWRASVTHKAVLLLHVHHQMNIYQKQLVCTTHVTITINESWMNTNNIHYTLKSIHITQVWVNRLMGWPNRTTQQSNNPSRATKCNTAFKQAAGPS